MHKHHVLELLIPISSIAAAQCVEILRPSNILVNNRVDHGGQLLERRLLRRKIVKSFDVLRSVMVSRLGSPAIQTQNDARVLYDLVHLTELWFGPYLNGLLWLEPSYKFHERVIVEMCICWINEDPVQTVDTRHALMEYTRHEDY